MRIDIISCVPEIFEGPFNTSILGRASKAKLVDIHIHNLRNYSSDKKHSQIDDYPYGGGAGMVLMVEPIANCIDYLKSKNYYDEVIYMSPDGEILSQDTANNISTLKSIIILCGRYKGIDERVRKHFVTKEISIGEYVISGGELAAAVFVDAVTRLIPGAISDSVSALEDSFQNGMVAPPEYTRPFSYKNMEVPAILLSGHREKIQRWRHEQAEKRTQEYNERNNRK